MIKVAIPYWQGRISPVFDVAGRLLLIEIDGGLEQSRRELILPEDDPVRRAASLTDVGTDILICGAISWPLEMALITAGIKVIAQICGEIEDVLAAFIRGDLSHEQFLMPGCCGRRRGWRRQHRFGQSKQQ